MLEAPLAHAAAGDSRQTAATPTASRTAVRFQCIEGWSTAPCFLPRACSGLSSDAVTRRLRECCTLKGPSALITLSTHRIIYLLTYSKTLLTLLNGLVEKTGDGPAILLHAAGH